jgi:hypothetical protein
MAKRRASRAVRKGLKVKDLTAGGKKGRKVKGGGLSTTTITTSLSKVGAVGPCFRPIGAVGPCDRLR